MTHIAIRHVAALLFLVTALPAAAGELATDQTLRDLAVGDVRNFILKDEWKPAPEITIIDGQGATLGLDAFRGKTVLLNFWATWCGPCLREMPALDRLQERLGGEKFQVVAVSTDRGGREQVTQYLQQLSIRNLGIYLDPTGKAWRAFGSFGMPTTMLISPEGKEIGRLVGPAEWDSDDALALFRHVIEMHEPAAAGSAVSTP